MRGEFFLLLCFGQIHAKRHFDITKPNDVLVFLHIQKTGGTRFNRHLVSGIENHICNQTDHENRWRARQCTHGYTNRKWLFSRYTVGWPCGVHADWTALSECVPRTIRKIDGKGKRRYFYITYLRDPLSRFVSEWQHVRRGATWKSTWGQKLKCGGKDNDVPDCYDTEDWRSVGIDSFLNCTSNLAFNRMTRMLTDLRAINCYGEIGADSRINSLELGEQMLLEAKINVASMPFFGMLEYQRESQLLFEKTFGLKFMELFVQDENTTAARFIPTLSSEHIINIMASNWLDVELYKFAKELFLKRLEKHNIPFNP